MAISNAVGEEVISRVVGWKTTKSNFSNTSPNLPQRIAILAEANDANQVSLDTDGIEVTSAQQAGQLYGFGSPIHRIMSILRPRSGGIVGGIPTVVYAQAAAGGAAAQVLKIAVTGTATANGTHRLRINGRTSLDGVGYDVNIVKGDTNTEIAAKIADVVNNVLGNPYIASVPEESEPNTNECTLTSKWKGLTSQGNNVEVDNGGNAIGITYAVSQVAAGSGTPSVQAALDKFGNTWVTIIVNSYGTVTSVIEALEAFNGVPAVDDNTPPTGRYGATLTKPCLVATGSVADNEATFTDSRKTQVTIEIAPAPLSKGLAMEAAANWAALRARVAQDTPHLDISGKAYLDMPVPADGIGTMAQYENRDQYVKKGCSTVDLVNGVYVIQDPVTTYHPVGEEPPQYRYGRNLIIDWNYRYGYYLLEQVNVLDHVIAKDEDDVSADNVIKPKQWRAILADYDKDTTKRGLTADAAFAIANTTVAISATNPDRFETFKRYKRTGIARVVPTTAEAGFNYGNV